MIERLKEEAGYSLVEVIVSIFILAAAIIPMVGMFDMGLKSATQGGNYDKARALANTNLEKVQTLPYSTAQTTYGPVDPSVNNTRSISCDAPPFTCTVQTTYVDANFAPDPLGNKMRIVVTVRWESNNSYTTTGLKAQ